MASYRWCTGDTHRNSHCANDCPRGKKKASPPKNHINNLKTTIKAIRQGIIQLTTVYLKICLTAKQEITCVASLVCIYIFSYVFFFFSVISKTIITLPRIASRWLCDTICNSLCIIYIISLAHDHAYQNNNSSLFQSVKEAAEIFTGSSGALKTSGLLCGRVLCFQEILTNLKP